MDYIHRFIELIKHWSSYFGFNLDKKNFEETFYQLLHDKNYDEALNLAQQYKYLDIDLVYKCRWRNTGITAQSIDSVLAKIQDKLWSINECVQTVPITYEACKRLVEFGLEEANLRLLYQLGNEQTSAQFSPVEDKYGNKTKTYKHYNKPKNKLPPLPEDIDDEEIEGLVDFNHLNEQQKELCRCRQNLLHYNHILSAYEYILGDYRTIQQNFDHVLYNDMRQRSPLNNCINFANEGNAQAVEIHLNFYTGQLSPHMIPILSNFPETLSPYQYRNLLPCLRSNEDIYVWRPGTESQEETTATDWSGRSEKTSIMKSLTQKDHEYEREFYNNNPELRSYLKQFDSDSLTQWYTQRALEMESRTLLLSCAIQLLQLGTELGIENLNKIHDDLIEFDRIIYECCVDNDIYMSFVDFNKKPEIDRLLLITGNSMRDCIERFRYYVIPYLHRREARLGLSGKITILRDYFDKLARTREQLCRAIYNDLLDKIECDDFVAEWTEGLDDVIDEIGEEIKRIERESHAKQLSTMANQTLALGDYNECYEACELIMKRNFKECWPLCCQLGMHKQYHNKEAKYKLLAFALAHCDDPNGKMSAKILDYVIQLRKRDEKIQLAYLQQNM